MVKGMRAGRAASARAADGLAGEVAQDRIYTDLAPRLLREAGRKLASAAPPSNRPIKVLILGINYAPEKVGIAVYTAGMAEALAEMGHDVQVVAGQPYYPGWKVMTDRPTSCGSWRR